MRADDRPRIHFTARSGWINDPLALTFRDGKYHLFYQHIPGRSTWAPECHWGHAVSTDLLRWDELSFALEPGDADAGVWSGSMAVTSDGAATIFYTSVTESDLDAGRIRTAVPDADDWVHWHKGPIVLERPSDPQTNVFRDPFVFRDGDRWRMLVGAGLGGGTAAAIGYSSDDLTTWTPDGVAASRPGALTEPVWTGTVWECPQIVEVDGEHVLVVSVWDRGEIHSVAAATGDWVDGRFTPRQWQRLTYGDGYYAGSVFRDADGRPCIVYWIRGVSAQDGMTWTGTLSTPHVLGIEDGRIVARPHPVLSDATRTAGAVLVRVAVDTTVVAPGGPDVTASRRDGAIVVTMHGEERGRVPEDGGGAAWMLVDGPVVEVWGPGGAIAVRR